MLCLLFSLCSGMTLWFLKQFHIFDWGLLLWAYHTFEEVAFKEIACLEIQHFFDEPITVLFAVITRWRITQLLNSLPLISEKKFLLQSQKLVDQNFEINLLLCDPSNIEISIISLTSHCFYFVLSFHLVANTTTQFSERRNMHFFDLAELLADFN